MGVVSGTEVLGISMSAGFVDDPAALIVGKSATTSASASASDSFMGRGPSLLIGSIVASSVIADRAVASSASEVDRSLDETGSSVRTVEIAEDGSVGTVSLIGVLGDIVSIPNGDGGNSPELDDFNGNLNCLSSAESLSNH
jgi:hypothetical protein